jgi:hypothetical protein
MRNPNPRSRREGALSPCSRWGGGARASELGNGVETGWGGVGWRRRQQQWGSVFGSTAFWFFISFFFLRVGPWKGTVWISESSVDHGQACCVQLLIWSYRLKQLLGAPDTNVEVRV